MLGISEASRIKFDLPIVGRVLLSHIFAVKATANYLAIDTSTKLGYAVLSNSLALLASKDHHGTSLRKGTKTEDSCRLDYSQHTPLFLT